MDIAVYVTQAVVLASVGLMGGALYAERRQRRDAQKALADALELLSSERKRLAEETRELVTGINKTHNELVQQVATLNSKLEAVQMRVATVASAGRPGPTHGGIPRPPKAQS